jgi:hypothetical protein
MRVENPLPPFQLYSNTTLYENVFQNPQKLASGWSIEIEIQFLCFPPHFFLLHVGVNGAHTKYGCCGVASGEWRSGGVAEWRAYTQTAKTASRKY